MKKLRIYVDTSVLGGCFDQEFSEWSNKLIEDFRRSRFAALLSAVTSAEVEHAPLKVRNLHDHLHALGAELLPVSEQALELVNEYQKRRILSPKFRNDMLHIALATVAEADVLVSWNFRHIVRLDKILHFNGVNIEWGYKNLAIYSPREVVSHEHNK